MALALALTPAERARGAASMETALAAVDRAARRAMISRHRRAARRLILDADWRARMEASYGIAAGDYEPAILVRILRDALRLEAGLCRYAASRGGRPLIDLMALDAALLAARWLRRHAIRDADGTIAAVRGADITTVFLHAAE